MKADFEARPDKFNSEMVAYNDAHAGDGTPRYETTHESPINDQTTPEQRTMQADAQTDLKSAFFRNVA